MINTIRLIFIGVLLCGCVSRPVPNDLIDNEYGWVKIYSTTNMLEAQNKADILCGKRAYYLKQYHESNIQIAKNAYYHTPVYIPFQCEIRAAAIAGNLEAQKQVEIENEKILAQLAEAKRYQYEAHKAYAKKYGVDSYSLVNPDGSIEAYSFDVNGNVCSSVTDQYGSHTYCD